MLQRFDYQKNMDALKQALLKRLGGTGDFPTPVPELVLHRFDAPNDPKPIFYEPVVVVVVQGKKCVQIGDMEHVYGEHSYFITGVDLPVTSSIMEASAEKPYLSLSFPVDRKRIAQLATEVRPTPYYGSSERRGGMIQRLAPEFLDAIIRLVEFSEQPERPAVMESLLWQEIHYRLLTSQFGNQLRSLCMSGSLGNLVTQAITWLKENYNKPVQVEELASRFNMAPSTFHKHFREVTTVSPLQYQKRLRLSEAQQLMLAGNHDVSQAAYAVGYQSPTQFSREYKRLFGESPRENVQRMRELSLH